MKKTAMQLLIDELEDGLKQFNPDPLLKNPIAKTTEAILRRAKSLLETEREQIEEAFKQSRKRISMLGESEIQMNDYLIEGKFKDAEQYYKDTYQ